MNRNKRDFDVGIVGAGPAGSAAAILCSRAGLRVLIIEREPFPRDRPGESLHPGVEPILRSLGLGDELRTLARFRSAGYWLVSRGASKFIRFGGDSTGPWRGFQIWRADLDRLLLQKATEAGAVVWQPCRAHRPILDNNNVIGISTEKGAVSTSFVIDASGSYHWLARHLDLPIVQTSPRLMVAYGYTKTPFLPNLDDPVLWLGARTWRWEARVKQNLYHWCSSIGPPTAVADSVPCPLLTDMTLSAVRKADMTWRSVAECSGPGYFLAGDAAAVMDPTSSHGVLRALMSGMYAAQAIAASIKHGNIASNQKEYRKWLTGWFHADTIALSQIYLRHRFNFEALGKSERLFQRPDGDIHRLKRSFSV